MKACLCDPPFPPSPCPCCYPSFTSRPCCLLPVISKLYLPPLISLFRYFLPSYTRPSAFPSYTKNTLMLSPSLLLFLPFFSPPFQPERIILSFSCLLFTFPSFLLSFPLTTYPLAYNFSSSFCFGFYSLVVTVNLVARLCTPAETLFSLIVSI